MKSKKTTYLLLAVALIIWGVVFYKLSFSKTVRKEVRIPARMVNNNTPDIKDSLRLDYRDPFLGSVAMVEKVSIQRDDFTDIVLRKKKEYKIPTEELCYYGRITNSKRTYCLIGIGNEYHQMARGDIRVGFKLTGIYDDSVYLEKQGEVYRVGLQQ